MTQRRITDDLQALLGVLPPATAKAVTDSNDSDNLLEVILDLGRVPTARFVDREGVLSQIEVTHADIDYVVERIGDLCQAAISTGWIAVDLNAESLIFSNQIGQMIRFDIDDAVIDY